MNDGKLMSKEELQAILDVPRASDCRRLLAHIDALQARTSADPMLVEARPEVLAFARLMEEALRRNDRKGGWKECGLTYLTDRLREETRELLEALAAWHHARGTGWPARIAEVDAMVGREAADVANFAMMIADVCGALRSAGRGRLGKVPADSPPVQPPEQAAPAVTCENCGAVLAVGKRSRETECRHPRRAPHRRTPGEAADHQVILRT